jgi:2,4-dienoyl-CoA reductase-like NADH-dependent reductase (Old Yellow Enzyme family)
MAADAAHFISALGLKNVDLLGFSLGGLVAQQLAFDHPELVRRIVLAGTAPQGGEEHLRNYQVPFAATIRKEAKILTGAVGLITEPDQANEIITSGSADLIFLAREMLREPYWPLKAQQALNQDPSWPLQYGYVVRRRPR